MTLKRFYQVSALLPVALPALIWPLARFIDNSAYPLQKLAELSLVLSGAALIGGGPYLLLVGPGLWLSRSKPEEWFRRTSLVAPLVFAAFLFLSSVAASVFMSGGPSPRSGAISGAFYSLWAIGVGYFYVGLVHLLRRAIFGSAPMRAA